MNTVCKDAYMYIYASVMYMFFQVTCEVDFLLWRIPGAYPKLHLRGLGQGKSLESKGNNC